MCVRVYRLATYNDRAHIEGYKRDIKTDEGGMSMSKPTFYQEKENELDSYSCTECGYNAVHYDDEICPKCGRKLDWSILECQ